MDQSSCNPQVAIMANRRFERSMYKFLFAWVTTEENNALLRFEQPLNKYLANDALRDFFLSTCHPLQELLKNPAVACHLQRDISRVYFDPINGNPLLSGTEQRIYNLARRMDSELMHVPFRSVQPNKQTEAGDIADINTYPADSELLRYNSGNYFVSRPANGNVFDENSRHCTGSIDSNLHVFFKRGFLEERLQEVKLLTAQFKEEGITELQFFVIYSRHSVQEGHFGASLVIMDPVNPDFPVRVLVCDTLLKELPQHPRWWYHFITEYSNVFGDAIAEIIEDLSHPLQKVNIKGDNPYRHDWDCPYYVMSMADALIQLVKSNCALALHGAVADIHDFMKSIMMDYYKPDLELKDREGIRKANQEKRWNSGRTLISSLIDSNQLLLITKLPDNTFD